MKNIKHFIRKNRRKKNEKLLNYAFIFQTFITYKKEPTDDF